MNTKHRIAEVLDSYQATLDRRARQHEAAAQKAAAEAALLEQVVREVIRPTLAEMIEAVSAHEQGHAFTMSAVPAPLDARGVPTAAAFVCTLRPAGVAAQAFTSENTPALRFGLEAGALRITGSCSTPLEERPPMQPVAVPLEELGPSVVEEAFLKWLGEVLAE